MEMPTLVGTKIPVRLPGPSISGVNTQCFFPFSESSPRAFVPLGPFFPPLEKLPDDRRSASAAHSLSVPLDSMTHPLGQDAGVSFR